VKSQGQNAHASLGVAEKGPLRSIFQTPTTEAFWGAA
jgi:hypothetical protein